MLDLQKALIAGSVSFLLATIIQFFRAFSEIRALQKGYVPLYQTTNRTKVDLTYIVVSALQAANSLLLVAICALNQQPKIIISLYSTFSLGCIIQLAINYHATNPKATISQTYILLYLIAAVIAAGSTYQYKFKTEILYLNTSTIILLFFLIIIDIFKPSRNAGILNLPQNGRFPSGETTASYWSLITFSWIQPLLSLGETKHLEEEDLPSLPDQDQMDNIIQKWYAHRNPENSPIWDTIIFTKKYAVFQIVIALITTTLDFSKPFFINRLLSWIQHHKEADIYHGILLLLGMFSASILQQILYSQVYLNGRHWGIQIRSVLVHEVFKKSLRRTGGTKKNDDDPANQGKIVSLMSTDINQLKSFITDIHSILIDIPLSIFYSITALIYLMGVPALSGLVVVLLSGPVSGWVLSKTYALIKITRGLVDKRIQVTNEALQGIRIIKYMAWESKFVKKIWQAREDELQSRLKLLLWNLLGVAVSWGSSIMVTFTSFFFYTVVAGHTLDAATAFTSISILSIVSNQLSSISELVSQVLNIQVTIVRLNSFLKEPELLKYIDPIVENSAGDGEVGFEKAEFGFYGNDNEENTNEFTLNCGSIQFPKGKLSCIIGPTGSGKTSLVLALLGEMKAKTGTYKIPENHVQQNSKSDISYCPQTPWLMSASIKDNILFGEEYDEDRYLRVVKACALLRDLELLQYGDLTTIGEKGVNLRYA
jgi:ABC-type multidrug transport system fused ATPase/permease subunit